MGGGGRFGEIPHLPDVRAIENEKTAIAANEDVGRCQCDATIGLKEIGSLRSADDDGVRKRTVGRYR